MLRGQSAQTIIKRPMCPRNAMFLSLLLINTSLATRRTRTRVIRGYDSTREGAWGDTCLFPILITLLSKGVDQLHELLGQGQEVLDSPQKYLTPSLVWLWVWSLARLLLHSYIHTIISLMPLHALTHPFIDPSLPASRLGKGKGIAED